MKKIILLILFIFLSGFVYAIDCNVWSCEVSDYNGQFADFSNPAFNGTADDGELITALAWESGATPPSYTNNFFNVTPVSIGDIRSTKTVQHTNAGSINATCLDFYMTAISAGADGHHFFFDQNDNQRYFKQKLADCGSDDFCYIDVTTKDTGITAVTGVWFTLCLYWNGVNTTFILWGDNENVTTTVAGWNENPFSGGNVYFSSTTLAQQNMYIDNYREFNGSVGDLGVLMPDTSPPLNSSWNVTTNNTFSENTTTWNNGGTINISSDLLSLTVTTDENSNMSCAVGLDFNYTTMVANNSNYKAATTDTTSHAYTIYDNFSFGNSCVYCSFIDSLGNEPAASSSGCLNVSRYGNLSVALDFPANDSVLGIGDTVFNATLSTPFGTMVNATLYSNFSSSWAANQTVTSIVNSTSFNFPSVNLSSGAYIWGVYGCMIKSICAWSLNFTLSIIELVPPSFSDNKTNAGLLTFNNTIVQINLTIFDESLISAYTLTHNDTSTGEWENESFDFPLGNVTMIWNYSIANFPIEGGTMGWRVWANDTVGNVNLSLTYAFIVNNGTVIPHIPTLYNTSLISFTNWFNTDELNVTTTHGVLLHFFFIIILIGMIVLSEISKVPAIMFISGVLGFFIGILFYTTISAIVGFVIIFFSVFYMIRGATFS